MFIAKNEFSHTTVPVKYDATGAGYATASAVSSGSFSHTGVAGATPILTVGFYSSAAWNVPTATYNGVAMDRLGIVWDAATANSGMAVFGLIGGCTGTSVTVAFSGLANFDLVSSQCVSYVGVQAFDTTVPAYGGTTPSFTVPSVPVGSMAIGAVHMQQSTTIAGYNQTSRYSDAKGLYSATLFGDAVGAGSNITFSATSSTSWSALGIILSPTVHWIPFDKQSASPVTNAGTLSGATFSHTGTSGATPVVAVSVASANTPFTSSTLSVTYNGTAMTQIGYMPAYSTYDIGVALFGLIGACTGSSVNVVISNSPNTTGIMAQCTSYKNVTSFSTPNTLGYQTTSGTLSLTVPSTTVGQRVVGAFHTHAGAAKGWSQLSGVMRYNDNTNRVSAAQYGQMIYGDMPATASNTIISTYSTTSYGWGGIATALTAAPTQTVTYNSAGAGDYAGGRSLSWTHDITGNCVIIALHYHHGNVGFTGGLTVGGNAATMVSDSYYYYNAGFAYSHLGIYYLMDPPTGTQTITWTITPISGYPAYAIGNSFAYSNVGSVSDFQIDGGTGTTISTTPLPLTTNGRIFNIMGENNASGSISSYSQTSRYSQAYSASPATLPTVMGDAAGGGGSSTTFSGTMSSGIWGAASVRLYPPNFS